MRAYALVTSGLPDFSIWSPHPPFYYPSIKHGTFLIIFSWLGVVGGRWAGVKTTTLLWWLDNWLYAHKLSLREKFREGLYDAEHKPRLNFARNYFLEFSLGKDLDFEELKEFYHDWRDYDEYVVLQKQSENL